MANVKNQGNTMVVEHPAEVMEQQTFKREYKMKLMTGAQMITLSSMRKEVGLPPLTQHNIRNMSIDSASRMIDDMMLIRRAMDALKQQVGIR